jgi:hypothetical protein
MLDARGEDDDWEVLSAPQMLQHSEAIESGKHDIENHQIIGPAGRAGEASFAVEFAIEAMASLGKEFLHHGAQLFVVIDEQKG